MYSHDFLSLLQLLTGQNGVLHLEPAEGMETGGPWHAFLLLAEGSVMTCSVQSKANDRVLLRGTWALPWLASAGPLSWRLEEPVHASRQFAPPVIPDVLHVRRLERYSTIFNRWGSYK